MGRLPILLLLFSVSQPAPDPVLIGAGDIAVCGEPGAASVADRIGVLLRQYPHAVLFTAGDNSNQEGSARQFERCFGSTWGRFEDRIRPSPGNHDYKTHGAAGYFDYFGAAAGERGKGYYGYDLGAWHVVALNSNCKKLGGCQVGSAQERWLHRDLEQSDKKCTLAYFHHPLFSSGGHGQPGAGSRDDLIRQDIRPLVEALYASNVEIVVNGHDHVYERFAPQNPQGQLDPQRGLRHFVVGTGGAELRSFGRIQAANSEVRIAMRHGVIRFVLSQEGYAWQFIAADDGSVLDQGSGVCH
ncbi:MAG: metallophosphoesterase [Deltaproteobacteria bacterium]|nr:metallophosphoesterase [Deltaproteobacteria bacterium]